ncbi:HAMP domain-containing sensor histidine kinase [Streptomyces sp. NPDC001941]|uniref:sensor histidine kinase n=1 Tax=Streptomyces sp. NPDC001941 TaxID=3154659 RepID=UPI003326A549
MGAGSHIRMRVALSSGAAFLVLGALLLGVTALLSRASAASRVDDIARGAGPWGDTGGWEGGGGAHGLLAQVRDAAWQESLMWSGFALFAMALCAVVAGWWSAGRALRPVHDMTARARRLSERTLHERIAASGPDDELKQLGDTIDALLARLEAAFDSQRRFIANASHELRTPLATQRAAIQIGLDDDVAVKRVLLDSNRRSERLIDGLLTLARGERGLDAAEDVDLAAVVAQECARYGVPGPAADPCVVRGNRVLLGQLAGNLLANAVAYNVPGGSVRVRVTGDDGGAGGGGGAGGAGGAVVLSVVNSGEAVPASEVEGLFEPFRRGAGRDRMGPGAGLGLSIVRSVAVAHGGTATAEPGPEGGLAVTVRLPT